jgi:Reverse transcriptase (RNA-dependent DNA polymerase)
MAQGAVRAIRGVYCSAMVRPERRERLAGESPVRVSARAPGSRPQPKGEIQPARAGRRKPVKEQGAKKRAAMSCERCSSVRVSAERLGPPEHRKWLKAGVIEDGTVRETLAGTPQGGVISPLLANIYLHLLDRLWAKKCGSLGVLIRYADDCVVMSPTESKAKEALRQIQFVTNKLGLVLHPEKTRMVDLGRGKGSFVFLRCTIRKKRSILRNPRRYFTQRWPSPGTMKRVRNESRVPGMGQLLPDGECRPEVPPSRYLRVRTPEPRDGAAGRAAQGSDGEVVP